MAVDVAETIRALRIELDRVTTAIAALETIAQKPGFIPDIPAGSGRRGRKFMDSEERRQVSVRMKKYWASRRLLKRKKG